MSELIELLTELSGRQRSFPDSVTIGHAIEELEQSKKRIKELERENTRLVVERAVFTEEIENLRYRLMELGDDYEPNDDDDDRYCPDDY